MFGSCIIHILYTGCAKIKKKKTDSGVKRLSCVNWQMESNIAYNISFGKSDTYSHGNSPEVPYTEPQQEERSRNQPCSNLVLRSTPAVGHPVHGCTGRPPTGVMIPDTV